MYRDDPSQRGGEAYKPPTKRIYFADWNNSNNYNIYVGYTKDMPLSVDTQEDLEEIRKII